MGAPWSSCAAAPGRWMLACWCGVAPLAGSDAEFTRSRCVRPVSALPPAVPCQGRTLRAGPKRGEGLDGADPLLRMKHTVHAVTCAACSGDEVGARERGGRLSSLSWYPWCGVRSGTPGVLAHGANSPPYENSARGSFGVERGGRSSDDWACSRTLPDGGYRPESRGCTALEAFMGTCPRVFREEQYLR